MDPPGVRLIDAGGAGQRPLGQRADGREAADDRVGVLVTLGHSLDQGLVAVGGRLDRVVVIMSQHTRLELADHLGALADRPHILGRDWAHPTHASLAGVPVSRAVLPVDRDRLAGTTRGISRADD